MTLYTIRETAQILGICPKRMGQIIRTGAIEYIAIGPRSIRISEEALRNFIEANARHD